MLCGLSRTMSNRWRVAHLSPLFAEVPVSPLSKIRGTDDSSKQRLRRRHPIPKSMARLRCFSSSGGCLTTSPTVCSAEVFSPV